MTIIVGNDHAAVNMKEEIVTYLKELGHQVVNYGVDTAQSCDYPQIGEKVGQVRTYLESEFEGGRHEQRVDMIRDIENRQKVVEK